LYKEDEDQELNLFMHTHLDLSQRHFCSPIIVALFRCVLLSTPAGKFNEISAFILEKGGLGDSVVCPTKPVQGIKPRSSNLKLAHQSLYDPPSPPQFPLDKGNCIHRGTNTIAAD